MQQYNVNPYDALISTSHKFGISYAQLLAVYPQINNQGQIARGKVKNTQQITTPILLEAPENLKKIELLAENIMDALEIQDWDKVNSEYAILKNSFGELKPILVENSISTSLIYKIDSLVSELDKAINSKKIYESKKFSNHITLLVSYILDYYNTEMSTNIDRLQFLGREIILNAEEGDWGTALNNLDYLNVIWKNLESNLASIDEQIIEKFSQTIDSLDQFIKNKNSVQTINQSNEMLTQILILEENYKML